MKRRELIKLGLLSAGIGLTSDFALGASDSKIDTSLKVSDKNIVSVPMPFDYGLLDEICDMNEKLKKSEIKTLYGNMPVPVTKVFHEQFQSEKGFSENVHNYNDFAKYVTYAQDKGLHFVYVLNSPKPFSEETYKKYKRPLKKLLSFLRDIGVTEVKAANSQIMEILSEETDFDLSASTSFEYHNIAQYQNLIKAYPRIKAINVSIDDNRNFVFLKNLKRVFPDKKIEIMLNERCLHGCPARISHAASNYKIWNCWKYAEEQLGKVEWFLMTNVIYPWSLDAYHKIGINHFKIFGSRYNIKNSDSFRVYLSCIENGTDGMTADDLFNGIYQTHFRFDKNPPLSDIIKYLPDIRHFEKYGDKCTNICGIDCKYCLKNADKIKELLV
ncbi:MAG: hypothetical protein K6C94_03370 [Candidatus Gastranaerophilales bacterium]|nr:hypothetical protein [Candidatus Gastranaerophilales bacterium]